MAAAAPLLPYLSAMFAGASVVQQVVTGKRADKLAEANAKLEEKQTAEEARRLSKEQGRVESSAKALAAAGGAKVSGSQSMFLSEMKAEHGKELAWLKESGASKAGATRKGGQNARSQAMAGATSTLTSGITSAYNAFGT